MKHTMTSIKGFIIIFIITISGCVEKSVQEDVGEYLDSLGRLLKKRLSNPGQESENLLRDLFDYYNHLDEILENITKGDEALAKDGYDLVQELIEGGGPPHLNIEIDFDEFLFKVFKNDKDVKAIHKAVKYNRKTWEKLKTLYEKYARI